MKKKLHYRSFFYFYTKKDEIHYYRRCANHLIGTLY